MKRKTKLQRGAGIFISPYVAIMLTLVIFPFFFNIWLSLHDIELGQKTGPFVGLNNYIELFQSGLFKNSLVINFLWTVFSVIGQMGFGVAVALIVNQTLKGGNFLRSILLTPYIIPSVVAALVWVYFYSPLFGLSQYILQNLRIIKEPVDFLGNRKYALSAIIVSNIWRGFPFVMLMILARLQGLPIELYEAAKIDGASSLQRFIFITLPFMIPAIIIVAFFRTIWVFNYFPLVYLMTMGGPHKVTEIIPIRLYKTAFDEWALSQGAALAIVNSGILFAFYVGYHYFLEKRIAKRYY